MNNKGMTLVELIITFALVLVIVVGLYNLIIDVKFQMEDVQEAKDLTEYSSTINNDIHYQLLRNRGSIQKVYKDGMCYSLSGSLCSRTDAAAMKEYCKGITKNCIVYQYGSSPSDVASVVIALNDGSGSDVLSNYGILYGEGDEAVFEALPIDKKYIMPQDIDSICDDSDTRDRCFYANYDDDNKTLIINFPLYLKDDTDYSHNYGFKIVAPIGFDAK